MSQMHFHAIETGGQKMLRGNDMTLHDTVHVVPVHRVRHGRGRGPANRRRTPAHSALEVARHLPAEVNNLPEDGNALAVHRVGDRPERFDASWVVTVDPLRSPEGLAGHAHRLENDQGRPAPRPGTVILEMTLRRSVLFTEVRRVGRNEDAMREFQ